MITGLIFKLIRSHLALSYIIATRHAALMVLLCPSYRRARLRAFSATTPQSGFSPGRRLKLRNFRASESRWLGAA